MDIHHQFENSSMLAGACYNTSSKEMSVTFQNGRGYTYEDVAREIWDSLIGAKSAGAYFNSIKKDLKVKS